MPTRVPIKVLLVDDNEIVRKGLLEAIEHPDDFTVVGETGDSEEVLVLARRLQPDLILMDVLMPGKNGIDVCRELTTELPDAKVLMLTALTDPEASNRALAAGARGYLPKLWRRDQLLYTLREVAEGRYLTDGTATVGRVRVRPSGNEMA